jgi:hypothetical protein
MNAAVASNEKAPGTPLRLWPGVAAAVLLCLVRYVLPVVVPDAGIVAVLGGLAGALAVVVWWLFFSRAPWSERVGVMVGAAVVLYATSLVVHVSIRTGMMGLMPWIYGIPVLALALVAGAAAGRGRSTGFRRAAIAAAILLVCGAFTLLRTGGLKGAGAELAWRWTPTPEDRLLARSDD